MPVLLSHSSSSSLLSIVVIYQVIHVSILNCLMTQFIQFVLRVDRVCVEFAPASLVKSVFILYSTTFSVDNKFIPRLYSLYGESTYHTQSNLLYVFGMLMTSELLKDNQDDLIPMKEIVIGELSVCMFETFSN